VTVTNVGSIAWRARAEGTGQTQLGIQLADAEGLVIEKDFARGSLPADVEPGASSSLAVRFAAPIAPRDYLLKFDMVAEGVTWFEPVGSTVTTRRLSVT
jgi:hypothetical protein